MMLAAAATSAEPRTNAVLCASPSQVAPPTAERVSCCKLSYAVSGFTRSVACRAVHSERRGNQGFGRLQSTRRLVARPRGAGLGGACGVVSAGREFHHCQTETRVDINLLSKAPTGLDAAIAIIAMEPVVAVAVARSACRKVAAREARLVGCRLQSNAHCLGRYPAGRFPGYAPAHHLGKARHVAQR